MHVYSLSLVQSGSFFTYMVPWVKRCGVTLNDVSRPRVEVISNKSKIFFSEHIYYFLSAIWLFKIQINKAFGYRDVHCSGFKPSSRSNVKIIANLFKILLTEVD